MKLIKKTLQEAMKTPGFSLLYVVGVAFTVAFTIIYGMLLYSQLGPVYPEYDRNSTVYLETIVVKGERRTSSGSMSQKFIDEYLRNNLKSAETLATTVAWSIGYTMVQPEDNTPEFHAEVRSIDPSFFDIYKYEFKEGKPFSQEDFDSAIPVANITEGIAKRLYGSAEEAVGKEISIDHIKYRIRGVFREGSALNVDSYGEIFIPYSLNIKRENGQEGMLSYLGPLRTIIKVKPGKQDELRDELRDLCQRINAMDTTEWTFYFPGVASHAEHILTDTNVYFGNPDGDDFQVKEAASPLTLWKPFLIALMVVLIIPALNISGLIGARMDRIGAELGVRRCFGANRRKLMGMVLTENLILTLIGGIIGLLAAWLISAFAGSFLLQFTPLAYDSDYNFGQNAQVITAETAFAPVLFIATLAICVILNLISAWIPAHRALRNQITDSLNSKR